MCTISWIEFAEPTHRHLVEQMLPMASNHSIVTRFIEEKRQLKWGRVNQALASAMDKFLTDYSVSIEVRSPQGLVTIIER